MERRNNAADLWYFMVSDERDSLKRQTASGEVCSGEMVQPLVNASKDFVSYIGELNLHAAHAAHA